MGAALEELKFDLAWVSKVKFAVDCGAVVSSLPFQASVSMYSSTFCRKDSYRSKYFFVKDFSDERHAHIDM